MSAKIIRMANQIAGFFDSQPKEEGPKGVANHINKFWAPPMRRELLQIVEGGGDGLSPMVIKAAPLIKPAPSAD